jgi:hypothetical protein
LFDDDEFVTGVVEAATAAAFAAAIANEIEDCVGIELVDDIGKVSEETGGILYMCGVCDIVDEVVLLEETIDDNNGADVVNETVGKGNDNNDVDVVVVVVIGDEDSIVEIFVVVEGV